MPKMVRIISKIVRLISKIVKSISKIFKSLNFSRNQEILKAISKSLTTVFKFCLKFSTFSTIQ